MRTIIAGSRSVNSLFAIIEAVDRSGFEITEVVSGTARGADRLGEDWAKSNNIPVKQFPADWDQHGKSAGYKRNVQMAEYSEALIALWDGESRGTKHMIDIAKRNNLKVFVYEVRS